MLLSLNLLTIIELIVVFVNMLSVVTIKCVTYLGKSGTCASQVNVVSEIRGETGTGVTLR